MIVKNATDHVIVIPTDPTGTQQKRLLMGWSHVSDREWAGALPNLSQMLEDGTLEELGTVKAGKGEDGKPTPERARELKDLSPREANKLLKECYDVKCLQAWLEGSKDVPQETRESIRVAIQDRIKAMTDRSPAAASASDKKAELLGKGR